MPSRLPFLHNATMKPVACFDAPSCWPLPVTGQFHAYDLELYNNDQYDP